MDWWCELFGYFNCRSIPADDTILFWGGTALAGAFLTIQLMNWLLD